MKCLKYVALLQTCTLSIKKEYTVINKEIY